MSSPAFIRRWGARLLVPLLTLLLAGASAGKRREAGPPADGGAADAPVADAGAADPRAADGGAADASVGKPDPLATARLAMNELSRNVQLVQRIRAKTPPDALSVGCVEERLAEARIGVQIGDQEIARLTSSLARHDTAEQVYALRRLQLLVERAGAVATAARICATQDPGGITSTKVEVEISPAVPRDDPTGPPLPTRPDLRPPNDGR